MFKTINKGLMLGIAALAIFALAGGTAQAQTATVTGTVTDADTGLAIEGAFVSLRPADGCTGGGGSQFHGGGHGWGHGGGSGGSGGGGGFGGGHHGGGAGMATRVETDANGLYVIDVLEAGEYLVRACACGYLPSELTPVTVVEGETVVLDFALILR
jgi:hypothetical protein